MQILSTSADIDNVFFLGGERGGVVKTYLMSNKHSGDGICKFCFPIDDKILFFYYVYYVIMCYVFEIKSLKNKR